MMDALEFGAKDVVEEDDEIEIITEPNEVTQIKQNLEDKGYNIVLAESQLVPDLYVDLDQAKLVSFQKMLDVLNDLDDVQEVYHNVNLPDEE